MRGTFPPSIHSWQPAQIDHVGVRLSATLDVPSLPRSVLLAQLSRPCPGEALVARRVLYDNVHSHRSQRDLPMLPRPQPYSGAPRVVRRVFYDDINSQPSHRARPPWVAAALLNAAAPRRPGHVHDNPQSPGPTLGTLPDAHYDDGHAPAPQSSTDMHSAILRWSDNDIKQAEHWQRFATEPNAEIFASFLRRLATHQQDKQDTVQLAPRVQAIFAALQGDDAKTRALRALCFATAAEALGSCGDRVSLGLQNIEDAIVNHHAEHGILSQACVFYLGAQKFRVDQLERIARQKYAALSDRTGPARKHIDELEVFMAYRAKLDASLNLPGDTDTMDYYQLSGLTQDDIDDAEKTVIARQKGPEFTAFLAAYGPWQAQLKRGYPEVFAARLATVNKKMEAYNESMDSLNSGAALEQANALAVDYQVTEAAAIAELTTTYQAQLVPSLYFWLSNAVGAAVKSVRARTRRCETWITNTFRRFLDVR